jgi:outer membrane cobalamin receptor
MAGARIGYASCALCRFLASMRFVAISCAFAIAACRSACAHAGIAGFVVAQSTGRPIGAATLTLAPSDGPIVATTRADVSGAFSFERPVPGAYRIDARARGYRSTSIAIVVAAGDGDLHVRLALPAAPDAEIGRVVVHAGRIDASADRSLSGSSIAGAGALRTADALATLSGVTVNGDAGSPGGDAYASIRGLRPGESETLLDGHPIGPLGVEPDAPDADGTIAGFNFQDAPYFALRDVQISFGAASDRGGTGALGGTIDLRTLEPSEHPALTLEQGFGNQGRALTDVRATGTAGRFGYALVSGAVGTYGAFAGASIPQTGLRGTDLTSATLANVTYHVSGDYLLRNDLAKLSYALSNNAQVRVTAYDATSWADKTGEGDNDYNASGYVLANAPIGTSPACPRGVAVSTDAGPACVSPAAYASAASGPAGGGPGAWQALRNQDYDARLTIAVPNGIYAFDAYADAYAEVYHRDASAASGPLDAFLDRWSTQGFAFSDDVRSGKSIASIALTTTRQTLDVNGTNALGTALVENAPAALLQHRLSLRDAYTPNRALTITASAALNQTSQEARWQFDPQAALELHATARDTFRIGAGRSSEEPSLQTQRTNLVPVGALNPDCGAIALGTQANPADVNVGSAPASDLTAESASDVEIGYAHRFGNDSGFDATLYDANVKDRIVTGSFDAGSLLGAMSVAPLLARIGQFCGATPAPGAVDFTLSRSFNAATARVRGIELSGRTRVSPGVALDYGYDVQSSVLNDLPGSVLTVNPTLVNGVQEFGVPVHKASLGIDAGIAQTLSLQLTGHFIGIGNPQQLPGYAYADASIERAVSKHAAIHVAIANVFGSHVSPYGLVGLGVPYATNAQNEAISAPYLQPFNERYGLAPTTITVTATAHL